MGRYKLPLDPNKISRQRYNYNRLRQIENGIEWNLSWEDWHAFWLKHGIDKNLDIQKNNGNMMCLYRKNLDKPFQKSNLMLQNKAHGMMGKPKPAAWLHKDPAVHVKFDPWHKMRSQANYRQEGWDLPFEDFCAIWTDDLWLQRGRASTDLAMTRVDPEEAWSKDNVVIVTRRQQLQMAHTYRLEQGLYGPRNKRK